MNSDCLFDLFFLPTQVSGDADSNVLTNDHGIGVDGQSCDGEGIIKLNSRSEPIIAKQRKKNLTVALQGWKVVVD